MVRKIMMGKLRHARQGESSRAASGQCGVRANGWVQAAGHGRAGEPRLLCRSSAACRLCATPLSGPLPFAATSGRDTYGEALKAMPAAAAAEGATALAGHSNQAMRRASWAKGWVCAWEDCDWSSVSRVLWGGAGWGPLGETA